MSCLSKLSLEKKRELLTGEMVTVYFRDDEGKLCLATEVPFKMLRQFSKRAEREMIVTSSSARERGAPKQVLNLGSVPLQRFDMILDRVLSTFRTACNMEEDLPIKPFKKDLSLTLHIYLALTLLEVRYHTAEFHSYLMNYVSKYLLTSMEVELIWIAFPSDSPLVKRMLENVALTVTDPGCNAMYEQQIRRLEEKYPAFHEPLDRLKWREWVHQELVKEQRKEKRRQEYWEELLENGKDRLYPRYMGW
ncbi:hypothetical protein K490DRAFT_61731 [Saccharata proteae CBS 121410]|uniref:Uncharacterized protein n=1 Tax=Saccharata proteae CBS 121410 TaxID=1314787 RepID=A0A9P4M0H3_9PEZI|nr:hypothetical protein K490DRAFT_61731 [Saccharata proteae CBS 121410]